MRTHSLVLLPLPANLSDQVRIALIDGSGRLVLRDFDEDVDSLRCFGGRAVAEVSGVPGKRNYNGSYWSRTRAL